MFGRGLLSLIFFLSFQSIIFAESHEIDARSRETRLGLSALGQPQATCLPVGNTTWPVKAIYLPGWMDTSGSAGNHSWTSEASNRQTLEAFARENRIRIAIPISPTTKWVNNGSRHVHTWGGVGLNRIESLASEACGGESLAPDRTLIGFSSGGFAAKNIGQLSCDQLTDYKKVLAIGTQEHYADRCQGVFHNVSPHVFPNIDQLRDWTGMTPEAQGIPSRIDKVPGFMAPANL